MGSQREAHSSVAVHHILWERQGADEVTCVADVLLVHEMEVIFFTDKTHKEGNGVVRSFFAIPDLADERCIVRDMATLWLHFEQVQEYDVFS